MNQVEDESDDEVPEINVGQLFEDWEDEVSDSDDQKTVSKEVQNSGYSLNCSNEELSGKPSVEDETHHSDHVAVKELMPEDAVHEKAQSSEDESDKCMEGKESCSLDRQAVFNSVEHGSVVSESAPEKERTTATNPTDETIAEVNASSTDTTATLSKEANTNESIETIKFDDQWLAGYNDNGTKLGKLILKSVQNPELARMCLLESDGCYYCPCMRRIVPIIVDGRKVVQNQAAPHICLPSPFRQLFFELKKLTLIYGDEKEIETFEEATNPKCEKPRCSIIDQRDWNMYFPAGKPGFANSLVFIREQVNRQLARQYEFRESYTDENLVYTCSVCCRVLAFVKKLPSGLRILYRYLDGFSHFKFCSKSLKEWSSSSGLNIVDHSDMDIFRRIPASDWTLSDDKNKLVVTEESDKSLYYEYEKVNVPRNDEKCVYACSNCKLLPYFACYLPRDEPRVIAPRVHHGTCSPKRFQTLLKKVVQNPQLSPVCISSDDDVAIIETSPSAEMPMIASDRFELFKNNTVLFITSDGDSEHGHKFVMSEDSWEKEKGTLRFECSSCSHVATATMVGDTTVVRDNSEHKSFCKPVKKSEYSLNAPIESDSSIECSVIAISDKTEKSVLANDDYGEGTKKLKRRKKRKSCKIVISSDESADEGHCSKKAIQVLEKPQGSRQGLQCVPVFTTPSPSKKQTSSSSVDTATHGRLTAHVDAEKFRHINKLRVHMNATLTELFIALSDNPDLGHKFVKTSKHDKGTRFALKCAGCTCTAFCFTYFAPEISIRSADEHEPFCVPMTLENWRMQDSDDIIFEGVYQSPTRKTNSAECLIIEKSDPSTGDAPISFVMAIAKTEDVSSIEVCGVEPEAAVNLVGPVDEELETGKSLEDGSNVDPHSSPTPLLPVAEEIKLECLVFEKEEIPSPSLADCDDDRLAEVEFVVTKQEEPDSLQVNDSIHSPTTDVDELEQERLEIEEYVADLRSIPLVSKDRFKLNETEDRLFIQIADSQHSTGHEYSITVDGLRRIVREPKAFRCNGCRNLAFLRTHSMDRYTVRCNSMHAPGCKTIQFDGFETDSRPSVGVKKNSNVVRVLRKTAAIAANVGVKGPLGDVSSADSTVTGIADAERMTCGDTFSSTFPVDGDAVISEPIRKSSPNVVNHELTNPESFLTSSEDEEDMDDSSYRDNTDHKTERGLESDFEPSEKVNRRRTRSVDDSSRLWEGPSWIHRRQSKRTLDSTANGSDGLQLKSILDTTPKRLKLGSEKKKRKSVQFMLPEETGGALLNSSDCPVDLNQSDNRHEPVSEVPAENDPVRVMTFIRPSNVWLIKCCKAFHATPSKAPYKIWGDLDDVDIDSDGLPEAKNAKHFGSGYRLISYLTTGSENHWDNVKSHIGSSFFGKEDEYGVVDGVDCSKMTSSEVRSVLFVAEMNPIHFAVLAQTLECTVVLYDYVAVKKIALQSVNVEAPTIVVGLDEKGYFLFF